MTALSQFFNFLLDNPILYAFFWLSTSVLAWYLYTKIHTQIKKHNNRFFDESESLPMASASTYLIPRLNPVMEKADSLTIVGGDASYFFLENGDHWANWLIKNAKAGVRIDYIFTKVEPEEEKRLARKCKNDNIHYHLVNSNKKSLVERFSTYHPTLLNSKDEAARRIWLEKHHPANSVKAEYVDYITPKSEFFEENFNILQKEVDNLLLNSRELILNAT